MKSTPAQRLYGKRRRRRVGEREGGREESELSCGTRWRVGGKEDGVSLCVSSAVVRGGGWERRRRLNVVF